jgi:membrane dipeptidase
VSPYLGGTFCSLERVADHIEHVAKVGGEDCVALGSDFDGFLPLPRGLRDAADLPRLTELLWRRGWRDPQLGKLLGGNALRYLGG